MFIYFYLFFDFMHMSSWNLLIFLEQCNILSLVYLSQFTVNSEKLLFFKEFLERSLLPTVPRLGFYIWSILFFLPFKSCLCTYLYKYSIIPILTSRSLLQGVERTQMFLKSLGRYGPTPFLWPLYGGEINQAFCRYVTSYDSVYSQQS